MIDLDFKFLGEIWLWQTEKSAWHFVTLPKNISDDIKVFTKSKTRRGFGSQKVRVKIGQTQWDTSIFPTTDPKGYILPIKKSVRVAENISQGDKVEVSIEVKTEF